MSNDDGRDGQRGTRPQTAILTRGFDPGLSVGSARPAVFRSSTYVFSSPEAAERAFAVASGRAQPDEGESVDLIYCRSGDCFVYTAPLYGGTEGLIKNLLAPLGIHGISVAAGDTRGLERAIKDATNLRLAFIETPANPTLRMSDVAAAAAAAGRRRDRP